MSSFRILWLLPVAALLLTLARAEPVHALACEGVTETLPGSGDFTDCAGETVSFAIDGLRVTVSGSGTWAHASPFSDLHVTVGDGGASLFPVLSNSLFENDDQDMWMAGSSGNCCLQTIAFVANDASERVFLGDDYSWIAKFDYDSLPSTWQARVDYTMDVPEPALGVVLLGGLAAVGIAGKRRR
jgi:hypothetical protein